MVISIYSIEIVFDRYYCRAVKAFQQVLWVEPGFPRACEVHLRLGLMLKVHADFDAALKHLTLALIDATTPASFSKLESKFSVFIAPFTIAYASSTFQKT